MNAHTRAMAVRLFFIGFVSILGQVILLRELNVAFYGVELIYTLAIGFWLISSGLGTIIGIRTRRPPAARISILLLLLSVGIPLGVAFIRAIRIIFFGTPGAYLPLHIQLLATALSLLPFGLLLGLLFRWTARPYVEAGGSLTTAYAFESLGGIGGGLAATLFLKFGIQNFATALVCAFVAAVITIPSAKKIGGRLLYASSCIIAALWVFLLWNASELDLFMTSWTHPNVVISRDSPYSRITVTSREKQIVVFENDTLLFDSEDTRSEEFTHLAALQHPDPRRVLLLGGGIEGIVSKIQAHSPELVDYVELNPVLLDIARTRLPSGILKSLEAQNLHIHVDDPRRFLRTCARYDLILTAMPEPFSGQDNRFYTLEFFRRCAVKLLPGGILAFRLAGAENYLPPAMIQRMAAVYQAAKSVFREVMVLPGADNVFLCSQNPLVHDPSVLISRMASRGLHSDVVTDSYLQYIYTNDRFRNIQAEIRASKAPMNTDAMPVCYRYTLMIWLSKFRPSLSRLDFAIPEAWNSKALYAAWIALFAVPALFLSRAGWKLRRTVLMGVSGFAGTVLETILLLQFQIKDGILFQDVGILLTSFMIGLFLGAFAAGAFRRAPSRWFGAVLCMGFSILSAGLGLAVGFDRLTGLPATFLLLLLSGFMVAATFGYAGLREPQDQSGSIVPLYAADLIGGGLGSLLAGILMVPLVGLGVSAFLLAPITGLSLLLVLKK